MDSPVLHVHQSAEFVLSIDPSHTHTAQNMNANNIHQTRHLLNLSQHGRSEKLVAF